MQTRLIALEVPETLLRLSIAIYPPGSWFEAKDDESAPIDAESWLIRTGIADWSWRAISALRANRERLFVSVNLSAHAQFYLRCK